MQAGEIGMAPAMAEALAEFRAFNYEQIYMRPASVAQGQAVVRVLQALVEYYADRPEHAAVPRASTAIGASGDGASAGSGQALREAVTYVAGHDRPVRVHPGDGPSRLGPGRAARRPRRRDRSRVNRSAVPGVRA